MDINHFYKLAGIFKPVLPKGRRLTKQGVRLIGKRKRLGAFPSGAPVYLMQPPRLGHSHGMWRVGTGHVVNFEPKPQASKSTPRRPHHGLYTVLVGDTSYVVTYADIAFYNDQGWEKCLWRAVELANVQAGRLEEESDDMRTRATALCAAAKVLELAAFMQREQNTSKKQRSKN